MFARAPVPVLLCSLAGLSSCWSPAVNKDSADQQVYGILEHATAKVLGEPRVVHIERPVDTLRARLLTSKTPIKLSLVQALDVAAENSRDFQRQKEQLYLAALDLTRDIHEFELIFGGGVSNEQSGTADPNADEEFDVALGDELSASVNTVAGTRIVASFVNTFLRSVIHGGVFDPSSILNLTITQPLLRGAGSRIVREPLTQSERNVIYAVRSFERFRAEFAVRVVSDYWEVTAQMADLANVEANYKSLSESRVQIEEFFNAGRRTVIDFGRAKQSEYSADNQRVAAKSRLQSTLDRFKLTLGLPVTSQVELDPDELAKVTTRGVTVVEIDEPAAIALALQRRYDHQTAIDGVEDAGRRILVSEDALTMALDFRAALNVPSASGDSLNLDWSRVNWSAGFELDLALDKLVERNAYRNSLISFDVAVRAREQSEDQIAADVRTSLRNIQSSFDSYKIQSIAVKEAETRVEATTDLYDAGRVAALEKLDAQDALLQAQLQLTASVVDYANARLTLINDLEAIRLEPTGLRFDPALPLPKPGE